MKRLFIFLILLWGLALPAWAVDITGTVNTYVKGSGDVAEGSTTINYTGSFRGASNAINPGDLLLLIQSQGAVIDSSNTDTYGDGVGQGLDISTTPTSAHGTSGYAGGLISQTAGTFEYVTVASVNGSQITLTAPLEHAYSDANEANWQIIVVPDYGSAGALLTGNITTIQWDGDTGGVIAFNATGGSIDFNGHTVTAAGMGFRGGVDGDNTSTTDNIANVVDVTSDLGGKGEGIAGTPRYVFDSSIFSVVDETVSTLAGGDYGRGAPGNAGGGAGPHNSGGGGGSNAGRGGSGAQGWVIGTAEYYAGYGGQSIFAGANMGGGGGAGDSNNDSLTYGGIGGGVILLRADSGTGSGTLDVSGEDAIDGTLTGQLDGAGGGGAGGTVITYFSSATTLTGLDIYASGGDGGDADPEHGGGGGGGGGLVMVNATVGTVNINGGIKGANEGINGGVPSEPGADGVAETSANAFVRLNTDFGDAPDSYGTISGGQGAYHFFADYDFNGILGATEQLRLGTNLDGEGGGNPGTGANSDDTIGADDEDGVSGLTEVDPQGADYTISASSITVTNTLASTATLHAWIDFDLNGTFDSDEYTSIPVASGLNGQNPATDLVWNTMPGITAVTPGSTTYLRLRLSTDSSLDSNTATGVAENGEVEDYALTVYDAIPTAQNVTRSNPAASITNADQLVFAVTFSESVQNVDIADFSVSGAGSTGASVSAVNGSGSSYTVTVDVADTDGQVNLDIANTTGIQDLTGNNLSTVTPAGSVESYTLDNSAPVITLQGTSPVNVILGGNYSDQGATALDNVDGDLTGAIITSGAVNTAVAGSYIITYNVSDTAGNAATAVTRTVTVAIGPAAAGTSLISASPVAITADGSSTSAITVQLKDANGNNLTSGGDTVALSTTAGTLDLFTDNNNGTYSATLTSSTIAGTATITGTVNAASMTDNATVSFSSGAADGSSSLITASPTEITADGSSTSTITVQLKDANGNNLTSGGDAVALSTTAGTLGSVNNNNNGTYSATLTSSTTAGTATITGTVNATSMTDNATVSFSAGAADGSSSLITASPTEITADGSSTSTITVQLKDANGNNLTSGGDTVALSTTAGTLGSVNNIGDGTYSAILTSSTTAGTAIITGTVNASSMTDNATVSFSAGAAAGSSSLITASPTEITADGSSTSTITVQLKDANGNNLTSGGDAVALSTTAGTLGTVNNNGDGTYSAILTSSTTAGTATITGTVNAANMTDNATVSFSAGAAAGSSSLITASPTEITADGSSTSTITVQLKDANGNNLTSGGDAVALSTTAGTLGSVNNNGDGTYSAILTSSTTAGTATITGTVNATSMTDNATVSFSAGAADGSSSLITASPTEITADGSSTSTITVQLKDANGNNLISGGDTVALSTTAGTLGTVNNNGDGTYSAILTSSTTAGTATISGTLNAANMTDNATVSFSVGAAAGSSSLVMASPTIITADGSSTSTITVQLKDANGNNLTSGGDAVALSTTAGTLGTVSDNDDGTYSATLTSSSSVETAIISATLNLSSISDTASVDFVVAAASASSSLISASPTVITADGTSTSIITVQLKDATGNNLISGGDLVTLSTTAGTLGSVTDNNDGTYSATLTSSTTAGTATISGTVNAASMTDNATVSFSVGAAAGSSSLITASPTEITADGSSTSTITVQLKDANGNNLTSGGDTVTLFTTAGTLGTVSDNGDGSYSATLTSSSSVETATISATLNSSSISDTASVDFVMAAASANTSLINASPDSIIANGSSTSTITVQLKDTAGNNLTSGGDVVTLSTTAGSLGAVTDNGDGTYSAILTSGTSAASASITATVNSAAITNTETVSFTADPLSDEDDDGDGITNDEEGNGDFDNDGVLNFMDLDSDNDGIPDAIEGNVDTDGDGIADYLDLDSDNDGLYDLIESGADYATLDTLHDGMIDSSNPVGANGLADAVETSSDSGTLNYNDGSPLDSDADRVEDFVDLDSDNDGLTDVIEAGGTDPDADGIFGNGVPTVDGYGVVTSGTALTPVDNDGDGVNDQVDLDSDNDGIMDVIESGGDDPDGDGQVGNAPAQVDSNGLSVDGSLSEQDTDGDGVPNQHDLDSDNDGIPDVTEAGAEDGDGDGIPGTGAPTVNAQGIANGKVLMPADIDADSILDPYDLDSDGDGIYDLVEGGGMDSNNDGLVDGFTDNNGDGFDDGIAASALPVPDSDGDGVADYQDKDDADNDGIADNVDIDDDNDGIPDALEGDGSVDSDNDGIPDSLDLDSDNDGLYDLYEAGLPNPSSLDIDNDGRLDSELNVGSNGLMDSLETSMDSGVIKYNNGAVLDTDADGVKDFRDLDSDNDSIPDVIESGGVDGDGDGVLGTGTPAVNSNGLTTGAGSIPLDTDADGIPDQQDLDTDNDDIPDLQEVGGSDSNNNGVVDNFVDSNGDGFNDVNATAALTLPDTDGDGTPDVRDSELNNGVVSAGLNGIGTFNIYLLGLLAVLVVLRLIKLRFASLLSLLALLVSPAAILAQQPEQPQDEYERHFYIGAGFGRSTLQPETSGSAYTLDDDSDSGHRFYGGLDLSESFSVELSLSDLGSADLKPAGKLDYSINAVNVLYYLYNQGEMKHVGMAAYLKAGLGKMDVTADIPYELDNSTQIALGAGLEYAWENGFAVRADLESFDKDASLFSVGLLYRFGKQQKPEPKDSDRDGVLDQNDQCPQTPLNAPVNAKGCQLDSDKDGVVDMQDQCPQTQPGATVDSTGCELDTDGDGVKDSQDQCPQTAQGVAVDNTGCALDSDGDGVVDSLDQCPKTASGIKVDVRGCALDSDKDGVIDSLDKCPGTKSGSLVDESGCPVPVEPIFNAPLAGVNFKLASAELTSSAKLVLDDAVKVLLQYPTVQIEIQAHTDSQGTQANNQKLSDLRAQSVFEYLQSKGIETKRMKPVGYGETMPLMTNKTAKGRAKNRRVEFKVIQ